MYIPFKNRPGKAHVCTLDKCVCGCGKLYIFNAKMQKLFQCESGVN